MEWLEGTVRDGLYGWRQLRKTPTLLIAVVLSLAVGIGANTAVFSLLDAAILRPLPVRDPDSLLVVEWVGDAFPSGVENMNGDFGKIANKRVKGSSVGANLHRRLAREQTSFAALMGIADPHDVAMAVDGAAAEQVSLQYVSSNFFQGLGCRPVLGRAFEEDDDRVGQEPVVIVSHRFWRSRLGGEAPGRDVRINNVPARIIGVAPPGFFGLAPGQWTDVYAPLAMRVAFAAAHGAPRVENDRDWWVRQLGRPKPGLSPLAATTQLDQVFRRLVASELSPTDPTNVPSLVTSPGRRGFVALGARETRALWILALLVAVVLALVCANVANLLLARSVGRERDAALRLALGASRVRVLRQHLVESGLLAFFGGGAGIVLGYAFACSIHVLFQSGQNASRAFDIGVDLRVLAYTGVLSLLAAFLFGLAPAAHAARTELGAALRSHGRGFTGGTLWLPRLLVAVQVGLCLAALVSAGLLARSLQNLRRVDVGFDREHLAYVSLHPAQAGYSAERLPAYVDRLHEALGRLPGVVSVSAVRDRPLSGGANVSAVYIPGRSTRTEAGLPAKADTTLRNAVGDSFFETLGIPRLAGRSLDARDVGSKPIAVVVDERFAQRFFAAESALGKRFGPNANENDRYEIVGVVGNSRYNSLRGELRPTVYEPYRSEGTVHFVLRTDADPIRLAEPVRRTVASVDPAVPVAEFRTQNALIDGLLRTERLLGVLSGLLGAIALALAAVGLGGLLAYVVARRTSEIGVRVALGSTSSDVIRLVLRDSLRMVTAGILIGLPAVYFTGQVLRTALFGLEPLDPHIVSTAAATLGAVALLAAWLPARRAARVDPMAALREP
jgi:predicted permease